MTGEFHRPERDGVPHCNCVQAGSGGVTGYDSTEDVLMHREHVARNLLLFVVALQDRAIRHDRSKLLSPEKPVFDRYPRTTCPPFGTDAYTERINALGGALEHHYAENRHHPEHHAGGVSDMTLVDILEMYADWLARSFDGPEDHPEKSLEFCRERFGVSEQLHGIFLNTYRAYFAAKIEDLEAA